MPSKAKFLKKTKEEIYHRDNNCCTQCGRNNRLQFHHIYFGMESNRGPDRNKAEEGVTLCDMCHNVAHSCKSGEGLRQRCIDYINKIYEGETNGKTDS